MPSRKPASKLNSSPTTSTRKTKKTQAASHENAPPAEPAADQPATDQPIESTASLNHYLAETAAKLGFSPDDFDDSDAAVVADADADADADDPPDEMPGEPHEPYEPPPSEYAISEEDGSEYSAAQNEPTTDLDEPSASRSAGRHARPIGSGRAVKSKGSERADFLYELKRGREAIWYRLKKAGFTPARVGSKQAGFRLDTDNRDGTIRVTFYTAALTKPSETDPKYFAAVEEQQLMVDRYDDVLTANGFRTHHASVDGTPYVILNLDENPVTKSNAPWNTVRPAHLFNE